MYELKVTDVLLDEVIVTGNAEEMKYQLNHMIDQVAASEGGQFYANILAHIPNQTQVQHVQVVFSGNVNPEVQLGSMYGSTLGFQTVTESRIAHEQMVSAMSGFFIEASDPGVFVVGTGYNETECEILLLTET